MGKVSPVACLHTTFMPITWMVTPPVQGHEMHAKVCTAATLDAQVIQPPPLRACTVATLLQYALIS